MNMKMSLVFFWRGQKRAVSCRETKNLTLFTLNELWMSETINLKDYMYEVEFWVFLRLSNDNDSLPVGLLQLWCDFDKSSTFRNQTYNASASIPDICFYPEVPTLCAVSIFAVRSICCVLFVFFPLLRQRRNDELNILDICSQPGGVEPSQRHGEKHPLCYFSHTTCSWLMEPIRQQLFHCSEGRVARRYMSQTYFLQRGGNAGVCK